MSHKHQAQNRLMRIAHQYGLPVRVFVDASIERFGDERAAALQLGVRHESLRRYTDGTSRFASRLVEMADARGMDILPFVIAAVKEHGDPVRAALALGVSRQCVYRHLHGAKIYSPKRTPAETIARLMTLLNSGMSIRDAARETGLPYATARYHGAKRKRIQALSRAVQKSARRYPLPLAADEGREEREGAA